MIAIVLGCFVLIPGLGMLAGGGAIAVGQAVATDDDGYFNLALDRIESDGVAVVANDLWFDDADGDAGPWVLGWLDLDVRLRVEGARSTDEVFVGIARTADVDDYLDGVAHSEIVELEHERPTYRRHPGDDDAGSPLDQDFWTVSTSGPDEQLLDWEARGGRWSIVVMNADGSTEVAADVEVGFKSGAVTPIAVFLLVAGGAVTIAAIAMIVIGARGRRNADPGLETLPPITPSPTDPTPSTPPSSPVDQPLDGHAAGDDPNRDDRDDTLPPPTTPVSAGTR